MTLAWDYDRVSMGRFLVRRLLLTVPVLLGVATLVFALLHLVPGDPAQVMLGDAAAPEDVADLRRRLGLDRPLAVQYVGFLLGLTRGDLGVSLRTNQPVLTSIAERLPATVELALAAMIAAALMALPLGTIAAVRFRADPDTVGVPLVTSTVDFVGAAALIAAVKLLGIG